MDHYWLLVPGSRNEEGQNELWNGNDPPSTKTIDSGRLLGYACNTCTYIYICIWCLIAFDILITIAVLPPGTLNSHIGNLQLLSHPNSRCVIFNSISKELPQPLKLLKTSGLYLFKWFFVQVMPFVVHIPIYTPQKTNMTMETQAFEDVSPIKNGDFPLPRWFSRG